MVGKSSPTSATKLPATAHGRRTRAAIVDAAAQMMYQKGVAATSLDDILAASSTGKSQLYHYFKDRSELVKAVVERQTELVLAAQPTLSQIDSMEGIERWAQAILANHEVPGGPFGCPLGSMAAELKNDPAYQPALAAAFGLNRPGFRSVLEARMEHDEPEVLSRDARARAADAR
ncbi:TetR/AcrR family transcriptional regulator [Mycobacteroides abscessus]|uniref:TetR/AcrR family transcriptional regulator n=1 Tax=Mycobacteroides abscessus TaxID=36809 RepID=UPI00210692BE|nr:TetR/AcrR family transcriptional regulator [Mycobacteroides abscessus]